jgi:hypothetical protein
VGGKKKEDMLINIYHQIVIGSYTHTFRAGEKFLILLIYIVVADFLAANQEKKFM